MSSLSKARSSTWNRVIADAIFEASTSIDSLLAPEPVIEDAAAVRIIAGFRVCRVSVPS